MRSNQVDLDERRNDLRELLEKNPAAAKTFWEKLHLSWVYHENALEGIVITPEELSASLEPPDPTVNEVGKVAFIANIRRQREVITLVNEEASNPKGKLSLPLVKRLFEALTGGGEKGKFEYRKDMPLHRTYFHEIMQPPRIVPELTKLMEWTTTADFESMPPLQQAAQLHHRFMRIFPFTTLSGKVGRLLMNVVVIRAGYLPVVIHGIDRQRYYESLKQTPRHLESLITEAIEHATDLGLRLLTEKPPETYKVSNG